MEVTTIVKGELSSYELQGINNSTGMNQRIYIFFLHTIFAPEVQQNLQILFMIQLDEFLSFDVTEGGSLDTADRLVVFRHCTPRWPVNKHPITIYT